MSWRSPLVLGLCLIAVCPLWAETVHIVQKGDTIYAIAKKYGLSVEAVLMANDIVDPQKVNIGRRLIIPDGVDSAASPLKTELPQSQVPSAAWLTHRVLKGETLYGLSRQYGISIDDLLITNGMTASSILKEGVVLLIPTNHTPNNLTAETAKELTVTDSSPGLSTVNSEPSTSTLASPVVNGVELRQIGEKINVTTVRWPVVAKELAYLEGKMYGVWILAERAAPVLAVKAGTVAAAGPYRGFGQVVIVRTKDGLAYVYGGCETITVAVGDTVTSTTRLGTLGLDQLSGEPRLFFFVYKDNVALDPVLAPRDP